MFAAQVEVDECVGEEHVDEGSEHEIVQSCPHEILVLILLTSSQVGHEVVVDVT